MFRIKANILMAIERLEDALKDREIYDNSINSAIEIILNEIKFHNSIEYSGERKKGDMHPEYAKKLNNNP